MIAVAEYDWRMTDSAEKKPEKPRWAVAAELLMRSQGLTQEDLKDAFQVTTRGAVGHYMTGRREPSVDQLSGLAKRLGVTVSQLIGEVPIAPDHSDRQEILRLLGEVDPANMPMLLAMLEAAASSRNPSEKK